MESTDNCQWKDDIRTKLISTFGESDPEALIRILFYLDEEDRQYSGGTQSPPAWRSLRATLTSDSAFMHYSQRLSDDTKNADKDAKFRFVMNQMYSNYMEPSDDLREEVEDQGFNLVRWQDFTVTEVCGFSGLAHSWGLIPVSTQTQILEVIPRIISCRQALTAVDEVVSLVNKAGGNVVMVGLAALALGWDVIKNMRRWWKNEITGVRCVKNITDSFLTISAGVFGGVGGAAVGSIAGPFGTLVGGVVGGILAGQGMNVLSDRMTQWIFGIPKEEALENAYRYFKLTMKASNSQINAEFRKLCLIHHPDKGGKAEDFYMMQMHMGVIKLARGELY